ncbi:acetyltransferase [Streptococcus pneumoniae]|nr:acetyltransferase [Streptococcus pneumoniae]
MTIELRDVTMENYFDVLNLDVKEYQKQFIATNAISLAEAYVYTKNGDFVAPLAVYDNDVIIGFVMIAYDKKIVISSGNYLLFRFMMIRIFKIKDILNQLWIKY